MTPRLRIQLSPAAMDRLHGLSATHQVLVRRAFYSLADSLGQVTPDPNALPEVIHLSATIQLSIHCILDRRDGTLTLQRILSTGRATSDRADTGEGEGMTG